MRRNAECDKFTKLSTSSLFDKRPRKNKIATSLGEKAGNDA